MSFTRLTADILNISKLADRPNQAGMSAAQLKAEFDKAGGTIKTFINSFITELESSTAASNIGIQTITGMTATKVQTALSELYIKATAQRTANDIASGAVTTVKIADGSITDVKIADDSVGPAKIKSGAVSKIMTGTISSSKWTGDTAPYTNEVTISEITADDTPDIALNPSSQWIDVEKQIDAWGLVYDAETYAGKIKFYAIDKPEVDIPVQVRCIRK